MYKVQDLKTGKSSICNDYKEISKLTDIKLDKVSLYLTKKRSNSIDGYLIKKMSYLHNNVVSHTLSDLIRNSPHITRYRVRYNHKKYGVLLVERDVKSVSLANSKIIQCISEQYDNKETKKQIIDLFKEVVEVDSFSDGVMKCKENIDLKVDFLNYLKSKSKTK